MNSNPADTENHPHRCWDFFDRIYCITLESRRDRRRQAEREFRAAGLLQRVEFVEVSLHPTDREQGIYESHMSCLARGLAAGARTILVFEDDIFFAGLHRQRLAGACEHLAANHDWSGFFLGCIIDGSSKTGHPNLAKITYRTLAHAYCLQRDFALDFAKLPWSGIPFDELLRRRGGKFYAIKPMCAFQGRSGTDNQRLAIHRARRMLGGLPFIQKANELYRNHTFALIAGPVAMAIAALVFLYYLNQG